MGKGPQLSEPVPREGWETFPMRKSPTPPRTRIAKNLRALMEMQGIGAPKLAAEAKVDRKTINNLVNGRFDPRLSLVERVANVFGMAAWQLLATDLEVKKLDSAQIVRLLERYSAAGEDGKAAIMQVAQVASNNAT